jgi:hypothetical protein
MQSPSASAVHDAAAAQRAGELGLPFAAQLFARVAAADATKNVFVSPFSVASALALLNEGASGSTAAQLKTALGFGPAYEQAKAHHDSVALVHAVLKSSPLASAATKRWPAGSCRLTSRCCQQTFVVTSSTPWRACSWRWPTDSGSTATSVSSLSSSSRRKRCWRRQETSTSPPRPKRPGRSSTGGWKRRRTTKSKSFFLLGAVPDQAPLHEL